MYCILVCTVHSVASQAEKQQAASKDTKQLRHYEENLLHNYKLYLQMLEECIGRCLLMLPCNSKLYF